MIRIAAIGMLIAAAVGYSLSILLTYKCHHLDCQPPFWGTQTLLISVIAGMVAVMILSIPRDKTHRPQRRGK